MFGLVKPTFCGITSGKKPHVFKDPTDLRCINACLSGPDIWRDFGAEAITVDEKVPVRGSWAVATCGFGSVFSLGTGGPNVVAMGIDGI